MKIEKFLKDFYNEKLTEYISWPTYRELAEDYLKNFSAQVETPSVSDNEAQKKLLIDFATWFEDDFGYQGVEYWIDAYLQSINND